MLSSISLLCHKSLVNNFRMLCTILYFFCVFNIKYVHNSMNLMFNTTTIKMYYLICEAKLPRMNMIILIAVTLFCSSSNTIDENIVIDPVNISYDSNLLFSFNLYGLSLFWSLENTIISNVAARALYCSDTVDKNTDMDSSKDFLRVFTSSQ